MGNWLLISEVNRSFVWSAIRGLFGLLDRVVFWLFGKVMQLMYDIVGILNTSGVPGELPAFYSVYTDINKRLYFILTVYMLFKITISLLQYLVNPDTITDKERGAGKLVSRIIISLVMLIGFPFVRDELMNLQSDIIQDQTIQKIVTGKKDASLAAERRGNVISASIYNGSFFKPDKNGDFVTCGGSSDSNPDTDVTCSNNLVTGDGQKIPSLDDMIDSINEPASDNDNRYKFNYMPLIGTVIGAVMVLLVLGMCIDIATRTFKLVILFAIAPIPILSYIDPKASKDGAFSKWTKMLITTWLELFIRMAIISFIFVVVDQMNSNFSTGGSIFVRLTLTIALLFFAKDAPKFICDALGIKMPDGGGIFGGIGKVLAAGALLGGTVGSAVGLARHSFQSDTMSGRGHDPLSLLKNAGAGLFGGVGGLVTGGYALATSKDQNAKSVLDARNRFLANQRSGNGLVSRLLGGGANVFGGYNLDNEIQRANTANNAAKKLKDYAISEGSKFFSGTAQDWSIKDAAGNPIFEGSISKNDALKIIDKARLTASDVELMDKKGNKVNLGSADSDYVKALLGSIDEGIADSYMDSVDAGIHEDKGALKVNRRALASAIGISLDEAASLRVTRGGDSSIKSIEKSNLTRAYDLESRRGPKNG